MVYIERYKRTLALASRMLRVMNRFGDSPRVSRRAPRTSASGGDRKAINPAPNQSYAAMDTDAHESSSGAGNIESTITIGDEKSASNMAANDSSHAINDPTEETESAVYEDSATLLKEIVDQFIKDGELVEDGELIKDGKSGDTILNSSEIDALSIGLTVKPGLNSCVK